MDQELAPKITKEGLYTGFKVLIKYLKHYKNQIIILSIVGILSAVGNGTIPYIAGRFFDSILTPATWTILSFTLQSYIVILILWAVIQLITYIMDWRINLISQYLSNIIWLDYLSNGFGFLLNLPASFHKSKKIGDVGNKINGAANSLETIVANVIIDLSPQILSIIIALAIALYLNKILTLFLIIGLIVYVIILYKNVKPLASLQKEYRENMSKIWGDMYDMIDNTIAIKQATSEKYEQEKLAKSTRDVLPLWMKQTMIWGNLSLYQRLTILTTQIFIFVFSVLFIHQGILTLGELLAFNAYAAMVFGPFVTIARNWQTIQNGIINIQETEKILETPTENYQPKNGYNGPLNGNIEFKNVNFSYDTGKPVLQDISFLTKSGDVIALVGESGVGKSTLIDLLSGYHFPNSGEILIDNHKVETLDLWNLRKQIAVVPQEVVLFNDTIKMNIKYGNFNATEEEMMYASRKAHAFDFINKFPEKWDQIVGWRGVKLSVGQKQRVAIARAILRNPRILILDEPTAALDAGSEKIITESLDELMTGKTTFIIAHRLSTVRKADLILVFKEGRIIETGKHDELLKIKDGEYRRLYELQIGLHT